MSDTTGLFRDPDSDWMERHCPICGDGVSARVFAESNFSADKLDAFAFASRKQPEYMHYRLLECVGCGLLYASPAPAALALSTAYDEAAFDSGLEAAFASRTYAALLREIVSTLPSRQGALDIGTGDGTFLRELLQAGFSDVAGVEPSRAPIASARSDIQPLIRHAMFVPEDFEANAFSVITCFQTIEHVYDPLQLCRGIFRLLRPGGACLLVGHNRRALSAAILGRRSPIFDIEHLQLFDVKSLQRLLERAGYANVRTSVVYNRYPLAYWTRLLPLPAWLKRGLQGAMATTGIGRVPITLPAGNIAVVGYKPVVEHL